MKFIDRLAAYFIRMNRKLKRWRGVVSVLSALVVFSVTYSMILPAITLDRETAEAEPGIEVAAQENNAAEGGTVFEDEPSNDAAQEQEEENVEASEEPEPEPSQEEADPEEAPAEAGQDGEDAAAYETSVAAEEEPAQQDTENSEAGATQEEAASAGITNDNVTLITIDTKLTFKGEDYTVYAEFGESAMLPEGVQLEVKEITKETDPEAYEQYYEKALSELQDKYDENTALSFARFYDINFVFEGNKIEPKGPVSVKIEYDKAVEVEKETQIDTIHFAEEEEEEVKAEVIDSEKSGTDRAVESVEFKSDKFSVYGVVGTETITTKVITASGDTYEISVTYGPEAQIPNGSSLKATEILEGGDEYEDYYEKTLQVLQEQSTEENYLAGLDFARFFDVSIYDAEGTKIEPKAPVEVRITYVDPLQVANDAELKVVHFAEAGTEIIDINNEEQSVSEIVYEQNGFSVIGTVGTTDAYGWPQSGDNPYVMLLQSGDKYYAVNHDGSIKEVHYLNGTVSFMGQGTTTLDYLNDYLWEYTSVNAARHTATLKSVGEDLYIDPYYGLVHGGDAVIGDRRRVLSIRESKVYANYYNNGYTLSVEGGTLHRTDLDDENAATVLFAPRSSFIANSSESEDYDFIDIETLIEEWKRQMTQDLVVDKTAEVYDYENRIYQVDLAASSGYHLITPALALEFVVDASRSMFFPENLHEQTTYSSVTQLRNIVNASSHDQVYYIISDQNNTATNWTVFYHDSSKITVRDQSGNVLGSGWYYTDASYYYCPDYPIAHDIPARYPDTGNYIYPLSNGAPNNLNGVLYTADEKVAGQPWSRLDYMKLAVEAAARVLFAVDPTAQIGLVTFNKNEYANGPYTQKGTESYSKGDMNALIDKLNDISLDGGTNHTKGLNKAVSEFTNEFNQITNCQTAVVLITDGAPVGTNWTDITTAANSVKAMENAYGQNTRLFTLGLSLANVGSNKDKLAAIATDEGHAFDAESSAEVVSFLTKIIEGLVVDANLNGNVTDVINAAFYPVNPSTGMPLESGTWITLEGDVTTQGAEDAAGQVIKEGDTWKVKWNDQLIEWPTYTDQERTHIKKHGWNGRVYLKAQEDFLGGNDINTNDSGSQAEAMEYINPITKKSVVIPADDKEKIKPFDTPFVNVDELLLDENSTEWTVYLGESVDPKTELQNLLAEINVYEVVKDDGSLVYTLTKGSTTNPTDKLDTGTTFKLSTIIGTLTEADWTKLIGGETKEIEYRKYGHTPGYISISLAQDVVDGEDDLTPSPHNTAVIGEPVEKYTLTVKYEPVDPSVADYHTGNHLTASHGADTNVSESENIHKINVFAKGMQITKTDEGFVKELTGAKFVLYRTARQGDDPSKVKPIPGATGNYFPVAELDLTSTASGTVNPVEKLREGEQYYLVETQAPTGYYPLDHPVPVTLEITNSYVPKPGEESQETKPESGIYDWTQTAILNIRDSAVKKTDAGNTVDLTNTAVDPDSENVIVYFRVANNSGYVLPSTGGTGAFIYTLGGLMLIITSALVYGFRVRRRERRFG